ncbi:MAG TPA: SLBB domain-containing protein [Pyrinomonadaceae bacterium]|nr:SLBB domain-containing protein [Pyrinomonadaceae bacterium]
MRIQATVTFNSMRKTFVLIAMIITLAASAAAQQRQTLVRPKSAAPSPLKLVKTSAPRATIGGERYRIGPGDVLEVRLYKLPDLSREALRVEESGTIRMPLIEQDIQAACKTEGELAKEIATRYLPLMRNPQVDVFIKEYHSRPVAVIGAVNTPGRFQLQKRIRLLDLLSFAGGPAERAGGNVQVVHSGSYRSCETSRPSTSEELGLSVFKLHDTLAGNARSNPFVRPGDVITVLEVEQIYVLGNVMRPSNFPLRERVTLSQAIAMAGGTLPDSASDRVRILRQRPDGINKEELVVNLKAISKRQAPDVVLQPNDIVEVPTSSGRRLLRNILEGVVPGIARMPVRVIR